MRIALSIYAIIGIFFWIDFMFKLFSENEEINFAHWTIIPPYFMVAWGPLLLWHCLIRPRREARGGGVK